MLAFFIIFTIVGFVLGMMDGPHNKHAVGVTIAIVISVLWMFVYGFWAIATFLELMLGYSLAIYTVVANRKKEIDSQMQNGK